MDDFLGIEAVGPKTEKLKLNPNLVLVADKYNNLVDHEGCLLKISISPFDWNKEPHNTASNLLEIEYKHLTSFFIQGAIFRKEIIDEIGGFESDMLGDDIILRTKLFNHLIKNPEKSFELVDESNLNYRIHNTNIHKNSLRQVMLVKEW